MQEKKIIVHLGLHKTGTTFLQQNVFPNLQNVFSVRGKQPLRSVMESNLMDKILFTDEALSGRLLSGEWEADFHKNIVTLKEIFGNIRVIIGFRKHADFILSIYKQYLQEGGTRTFEYIFNKENSGLIKHHEMIFNDRIDFVKKHFSKVFIYSKEKLETDFDKFIPALCSFLEIEDHDLSKFKISYPNLGVKTNLQVKLLRKLNQLDSALKKLPGSPSINGRVFIKLRLTPRKICQDYLKNWKSATYEMSTEYTDFINSFYDIDWKSTEEQLSF